MAGHQSSRRDHGGPPRAELRTLPLAVISSQTRLARVIRRLILATGLAIAVLMSGWITAAANVRFSLGTADRNLTYCNSQQLDLYIPRTAPTRPLPIVLYVHGGSFTAGHKSDLNPTFLGALASAGYAFVSVNYRLAPASHFPAQIEDVKCAIRYLRAKANH